MMHPHPRNQRGIALATSLIFLIVITLLGLVAVRTSTTELKLAHNEQTRVEAMETAQSVIDAVLAGNGNLPVRADTNYMLCHDSGDAGNQANCPDTNPGLTLASTGSSRIFNKGVYAEVRRLQPETAPVPDALMSSMARFGAASFAVRGQYDRGEVGLGAADIEQGIIKLVPKPERTN